MTKLDAALDLAKKGFRVFPVRPNSKAAAIEDFPNRATTDPRQIDKWFGGPRDYNIGISTNEYLVIDVDTKKGGHQTIDDFNRRGFYFPPTTQQITTTDGLHLFYKAPFPVKNSVEKVGKGLDVRGYGGYVVAAGSTLNGKEYRIDTTHPIAEPTDWMVSTVEQANTSPALATTIAAEVDSGKAWDRGSKYLKTIGVTNSGERNHKAYAVAAQLKDIGMSEADAFSLMFDQWDCQPSLDIDELAAVVKSAFKYGKNPQGSASPEAQFGSVEVAEGENEEGHPLENINKDYSFVVAGGGHHILFETTDEEGKYQLQHINELTFHKKLASMTFTPDGGKPQALTKMWMSSDKRRSYDGLVFAPQGTKDNRFFNLWKGHSCAPTPKSEWTPKQKRAVEMWREHLFENIANGNPSDARWIEAWCAHMIQKPEEKPLTSIVLKGKKGTGKNVFIGVVGELLGPHYMETGDRRYLTSNFNGHLENVLLLTLDEAFWSGDKQGEGILKVLITGVKGVMVEHKGKEPYKINSLHRVAILGNEDWVVPASHDERRFAVFNVGDGKKQDQVFFEEYMDAFENGGYSALLAHLKDPELLQGVNVKQIPMTEGLLEQKERSLGPLESWWRDVLAEGFIRGLSDFDNDVWPKVVAANSLRNVCTNNTKSRGIIVKWAPDERGFIKSFGTICPVKVVKGDLPGLYFELPSLIECRNAWDRFIGQKTKWI